LVSVNGVPLIAYTLGWLAKHGITRMVISCGYRWEALQSALGDGGCWGLDIRYAVEKEKLGRGGGIRFAMQTLEAHASADDRVVVANGDNVVDLDLGAMIAQHAASTAIATIALAPLVSARGIIETDEQNRVLRFREKPELPYWINAGIYVFDPAIARLLPAIGDHEDELFPRLAAEGRLRAYKSRELWRTVDTAKDLTALTDELQAGLAAPCLPGLGSSTDSAQETR
jgi:NDP-sugar pyrophosphorylase family protein